MKNLVSVITPAYNNAKTIRQCVESIRSQTYSYWEHIVIDDGSIDDSWEIIKSLEQEDSRLQIIRQANAGQANARNGGISIAKGEYIALLDADDVSLPYRLEKQVEFMEKNIDIDVLGGSIINISSEGKKIGISKLVSDHDKLVAGIYKRTPFFTSTVMARLKFFKILNGFAEELRRAQDFDLWLRGYKYFRYHNLQEVLVYYHTNTRPNFRNALWSSRVILKAAIRDKKCPHCFWYALRPLIATTMGSIGIWKSRI